MNFSQIKHIPAFLSLITTQYPDLANHYSLSNTNFTPKYILHPFFQCYFRFYKCLLNIICQLIINDESNPLPHDQIKGVTDEIRMILGNDFYIDITHTTLFECDFSNLHILLDHLHVLALPSLNQPFQGKPMLYRLWFDINMPINQKEKIHTSILSYATLHNLDISVAQTQSSIGGRILSNLIGSQFRASYNIQLPQTALALRHLLKASQWHKAYDLMEMDIQGIGGLFWLLRSCKLHRRDSDIWIHILHLCLKDTPNLRLNMPIIIEHTSTDFEKSFLHFFLDSMLFYQSNMSENLIRKQKETITNEERRFLILFNIVINEFGGLLSVCDQLCEVRQTCVAAKENSALLVQYIACSDVLDNYDMHDKLKMLYILPEDVNKSALLNHHIRIENRMNMLRFVHGIPVELCPLYLQNEYLQMEISLFM